MTVATATSRGPDAPEEGAPSAHVAAHGGPLRPSRPVIAALVEAADAAGFGTEILEDHEGRRLTYRDIFKGTFALGSAFRRLSAPGEAVGVLLPTGPATAITFFALLAEGRIPAMLNFTSGAIGLRKACEIARVKTVLTAHRFVELAAKQDLVEALGRDVRIVYLEDLRAKLTLHDKARALLGSRMPGRFAQQADPDTPAVFLFTSGSEGEPKGVALSHANLVANVDQIRTYVDLEPNDVVFNPLPMFHSYGLTAGTLMPLVMGLRVVLHPSPLQPHAVCDRIEATRATLLLSTDTFLRQYLKASRPGQLGSLRYAICGAEKVRPDTRAAARDKAGIEILEGYGVTETAPVLSLNHPLDNSDGTVGHPLPGVELRLVPVEGIEGAATLHVRGPNVMLGYLDPARPGAFIAPKDGWHDTGDVVSIRDTGHIVIEGRLKRFAKIGGERVSLALSETLASVRWPEFHHVAAAVPDPRKGERIVLLTDMPEANLADLRGFARAEGLPEIAIPAEIIFQEEIPLLGSGKLDYAGATRLARELVAEREQRPTLAHGATPSPVLGEPGTDDGIEAGRTSGMGDGRARSAG